MLTQLADTIQRHPKRLTALVAALLLGGGGGAFAVASFAPDPSDLPVREVLEAVQPLPLVEQAEALDTHRFNLFRSDLTRSSDTADTLLKRLGLNDAAAAAFLRNDANARIGLLGRAGRNVTVEASDMNELLKLQARWSPDDGGNFQRLVVEKTPQGFASRIETAALTASSRLAGGIIRSSLFAATDDARIPDGVAVQLAEMFAGDIDFHRALRKGDRFSVVYETLEADGEPLRTGRVLSAEFVNDGKTYQAMWFQEPGQKGAYYTLDGQSLRRAYLTSPVAFSRITSGFAMRLHPIMNKWRAHTGVDFAAPTGTPARTVGDGVVEFAGTQNGYGNIVIVKHRGADSTAYAHLSRINVRRGQQLSQGDIVGLVGSTGWATGPHLHFEFRVNGVYRDPMTIARQTEAVPVSAAARPAFDKLAASMRVQLSSAATVQQASAQ
ncbi:M23 family metallopeptidase [Variovorax sp. CYS-02]|uniref:M23 family metallopeptidase n=1 Tax=Variovorax terrae TaxID=2923278 RepID=A0A9X1VWA8_9BURK|nr:M23 family metallopeptidase [Variovorax terrae]MCJ0761798.1 M23 family metallopeptidase [Variovorax terrae]